MKVEQTESAVANVKISFEPVQVENTDSAAFNAVFNTVDTLTKNLAPDEEATVNANGQIEITKRIDEDLECTYVYGEKSIPRDLQYKINLNDVVSGITPFKENVCLLSFSCTDFPNWLIFFVFF